MQKLVEGIHQFQNDIFSSKQRLYEGLVDGQYPLALFITCSDSRINPNLLTQTEPGELIILRNAGNIVYTVWSSRRRRSRDDRNTLSACSESKTS